MIGNLQVYNMRANYGGAYGRYGIWNYLQSAYDYLTGSDEPPSYEQATAADPNVIVAQTKVKDGAYSWIVYRNYAETLAVLRKRSKEVDKVLAQGGLDGAKLAAGATFEDASKKTATTVPAASNGSSVSVSTSTSTMAPVVAGQVRRTPWGAIGGAGIGVIGLIILVVALTRKKGKKS